MNNTVFYIRDIIKVQIKNGGIVVGMLTTYGTTLTENGVEKFFTVTLSNSIALTFYESETDKVIKLTTDETDNEVID